MGPPKLVQPRRRKTRKISVQACVRRCGGMEGGYRRDVTRTARVSHWGARRRGSWRRGVESGIHGRLRSGFGHYGSHDSSVPFGTVRRDVLRGCLRGLGAGGAFEGAGDVGGDPASIEVAGLGDDTFAVEGALVDAVGVEGDVVAQFGVGGEGLDVAPGGVEADGAGRLGEVEEGIEGEIDGPVGGEALELAQGCGKGRGLEEVHGDVGVGNVIDGGVAGLEDAEGAGGFGEEDAAVDDADVVVDEFETGRARVVPYGLSR